ncbi:MAG: LytTR family transcriptional regulator [Treponema sp.]|nr:LytTR family transcriptional regulator [Treponema sp.]
MKVSINLTSFFRDLAFVETECTLSFAVIGSLFARNASISYSYFFIPLLMGLICMIPCIPVYIKDNMTIPQVIAQRSIELVILEIVCVWSAKLLAGTYLGTFGLIAVAFSVLFFDVLSYYIMFKMEQAESKRLNQKIKEIAEKARQTNINNTDSQSPTPIKIEGVGQHDCHVQLPLNDILYFEADAEQVFAYTNKEIYQIKMRLYQVESLSRPTGIIRVSKSHLINSHKIQSVRTALNSRLYARMPNGEDVLVSRKYAPLLKEAMS